MIVDLHDTPDAELPRYDVCIVGSGPAGMTLARELEGSGLEVCVLESGRLKTSRAADALRPVHSVGITIKDYSRERVLGGASSTWAGLSSPLDAADMAPRPYLGLAGWPIRREDLLPWYELAAERFRFAPLALFGPEGFGALKAEGDRQLTWSALDEKVFLACEEPQHFGKEHKHIFEQPGIDLVLDATVLRLEAGGADADEQGLPCVGHVLVRTGAGVERQVAARVIVVATGGIENARLLLQSTDICPAGLGNERDQVGRRLMNHPKNYGGLLRLAQPLREMPYHFGCLHQGYAGYAGLRLTEDEQRERGLLNSYVRFEPLFPWSDNRGVEALVLFAKRSRTLLQLFKRRQSGKLVSLRDYSETGDDSDLQNARKSALEWLGLVGAIVWNAPMVARYLWARLRPGAAPAVHTVRLRNFMEMEPDPENRVLLGAQRDAHGQPIPEVRHDTGELDRRSLLELHEVLAREFPGAGLGELQSDLASADPWPIDLDASHHMGTTCMGADPASSVTEANGRLHSVGNVYMAGGSLFPTSGCANPTFTIVALSIRMAAHLRNRLGVSESDTFGRGRVTGPIGGATGAATAVGAGATRATGVRRVLVIGAGGRVQTDVLPTLVALPDRYVVASVFGKRRRRVEAAGRGWETRDIRQITPEDVATADLIYLAVSKGAVPSVLRRLEPMARGHVDLLVDTPVFLFKHLGHLGRLSGYRNVWVAEDCTTLPWLELLADPRVAQRVGPWRELLFDRSAYRYHAFALMKTLLKGAPLRSGRRRAGADGRTVYQLRFGGGARATLIEPRDYADGSFRLVGSQGALTDAPDGDGEFVELTQEAGRCTGFRVGDVSSALSDVERELLGPVQPGDTLTSRMEELKRVGLHRLLVSVHSGQGAYALEQGLDDMFVDWCLERSGRYLATPLTSMRSPVARTLIGGGLRLVVRG